MPDTRSGATCGGLNPQSPGAAGGSSEGPLFRLPKKAKEAAAKKGDERRRQQEEKF